jgi:hypothetical protein
MQIIVSKPIVMHCPKGSWTLSLLALPCRICGSCSLTMLHAPGRAIRLQCCCGWSAKLGRVGTWLLQHSRAGTVPLGAICQRGEGDLQIDQIIAGLTRPEPACRFQQED